MIQIIKHIFCRHTYIRTNEMWSIFGTDHVTKVCTKCGKRIY